MSTLVQQLYNAAALASIYALVALGITIVYGLTRLVNFAQGQMLTLGAFIAYSLIQIGLQLPIAVLLSMILSGLVGEALDLGLFRRTLDRPLGGLIISLGLISVMQAIFIYRWGVDTYALQPWFKDIWNLAGVRIDQPRLTVIAVTVIICALLYALLEWTDWGRATRALAEDRTAARTLGVPVGRLITLTFFVGSGLAGLAGALLGTVFTFNAYSGSQFLLKGFAVAIIGGLGNVGGAALASLILALTETLGTGYISVDWAPAFGLGAMVLILAIRPGGLLRGTERGSEEGFGGGWAVRTEASSPGKQSRGRFRRYAVAAAPFVIGSLLVFGLPAVLPDFRAISVATAALVSAAIAYSLWLTFHYVGLLTIVQGALMGVGAYTAGLLSHQFGLGFWIELPVAALMGGIVALLMGVVSLRAAATGAVILSFAIAEFLVLIFSKWTAVTGGVDGMILAKAPDPLGPIAFSDPFNLYYLMAVLLAVIVACSAGIRLTAFGRRLITIRDNERLAKSLGLDTYLHKLAIFSVGGAVAAVGGVMFLYQEKYVEPTLFSALAAISVQLVVILGGVRSPIGPILGALFIAFLPEVLKLDPNGRTLAYGVLLVLVIVLMPQGLTGTFDSLRRRITTIRLIRQ